MEYFLKLVTYFVGPEILESCWVLSEFHGVFQYYPDRYLNLRKRLSVKAFPAGMYSCNTYLNGTS